MPTCCKKRKKRDCILNRGLICLFFVFHSEFNTIFLQVVVHLLPCLHLQTAGAVRIARLQMWRLQCNFSVERHCTVLNGAVTVLYSTYTVLNGVVRCCRPFTEVNENLYGLLVRFCTVAVWWTVNGPFFWCRTVTVG